MKSPGNFRKMLTLEQYKSPEMSALYQKVLVSGPLEYIENLLCEMSKGDGGNKGQPLMRWQLNFILLLSAFGHVRWGRLQREKR